MIIDGIAEMNSHVNFLFNRASSPKLSEPVPSNDELEAMFKTALRAPDHAGLKPARFLVICCNRLNALGVLFEDSLMKRNPDATSAQKDRARMAPHRAPMIVVVVARIVSHPKVPAMEQRLSSACSAYAILLSAEAFGYAGIWRTGDVARDPYVADGLNLEENEEIIGFIYLGTRQGERKSFSEIDSNEHVARW